MPRAILVYRLPEESVEYEAATTGAKARSVLWDIDQHCRSLLKYGEPTEGQVELAERIREMIPADLLE